MTRKKGQVSHVEVGRRVPDKEQAINKDLAKLKISIHDLRVYEACQHGKETFAIHYHFDLSRRIEGKEFYIVRKILRKHLPHPKKGGKR